MRRRVRKREIERRGGGKEGWWFVREGWGGLGRCARNCNGRGGGRPVVIKSDVEEERGSGRFI